MAFTKKKVKRAFRRKATDSDDEANAQAAASTTVTGDEQNGNIGTSASTTAKAKLSGGSSKGATKKKAKEKKPAVPSLLSFDEEDVDLESFRKKKSRARQQAELEIKRAEEEKLAKGKKGPAPAFLSATAGEYTAEKMAELRKNQPFQLRSMEEKPRQRGGRVTADKSKAEPASQETAAAPTTAKDKNSSAKPGTDPEEEADAYDEESIRQIRIQRERRRKIAAGEFVPSHLQPEMVEDSASPSFIPLKTGQDRGSSRRRSQREESGDAERGGGEDEEELQQWEEEQIRRGGRTHSKSSTTPGATAASPVADARPGVAPYSASAMSSASLRPQAPALRSIAQVEVDVDKALQKLRESTARKQRQLNKISEERRAVETDLRAMREELRSSSAQFEFFQRQRDFVADLCSCLREKAPMVNEVQAALLRLATDALAAVTDRRAQDLEDQLEQVRTMMPKSMVSLTVGDYRRRRTRAEREGDASAAIDFAGRDRSFFLEQQKGRRRRDREERYGRQRARWLGQGLLQGQTPLPLPRLSGKRPRGQSGKRGGVGGGGHKGGLSNETSVLGDFSEIIDVELEAALAEEELLGLSDSKTYMERREKLLQAASIVFDDVSQEFGDAGAVAAKFEHWKRQFPKAYRDSYCALSLPEILETYVRQEMLSWPFLVFGRALKAASEEASEESALADQKQTETKSGAPPSKSAPVASEAADEGNILGEFESFEWFQALFDYGQSAENDKRDEEAEAEKGGDEEEEEEEEEDPDQNLVPKLLERVVLPMAQHRIDHSWDVFSPEQTRQVATLLQELRDVFELEEKKIAEATAKMLSRLEAAVASLCLPYLTFQSSQMLEPYAATTPTQPSEPKTSEEGEGGTDGSSNSSPAGEEQLESWEEAENLVSRQLSQGLKLVKACSSCWGLINPVHLRRVCVESLLAVKLLPVLESTAKTLTQFREALKAELSAAAEECKRKPAFERLVLQECWRLVRCCEEIVCSLPPEMVQEKSVRKLGILAEEAEKMLCSGTPALLSFLPPRFISEYRVRRKRIEKALARGGPL